MLDLNVHALTFVDIEDKQRGYVASNKWQFIIVCPQSLCVHRTDTKHRMQDRFRRTAYQLAKKTENIHI